MPKKNRTIFKQAFNEDDALGRHKEGEPTARDLHIRSLIPSSPSRHTERIIRYANLGNNLLLVEVWESYCPKERGAWGNQRSVFRARYTLRRIKIKGRRGEPTTYYSYKAVGNCEQYYWSGGLEERQVFNDEHSLIKKVRLTPEGKLVEFTDSTRGMSNQRIVIYHYNGGERTLIRWRGKYSDKGPIRGWSPGEEIPTRRTEDGTPLLDNGDFVERLYRADKTLKSEVRYVAGRRHGVLKEFNKFGRVVYEAYFHHGTEIPGWVYRKPEDVTVEEILDEKNTEVRRAMLELQGFEVFMARCQAKGLVQVVDEDKDEKVGSLLRITLDERDSWRGDTVDARIVMLLKVKDGTLPKSYVLRVPPNMKTARQANAWSWGLTAEQYHPVIER